MDFKKLYNLVDGARITLSFIMFIIATAKLFGWGLAFYEISEAAAMVFLGFAGGSIAIIYRMIILLILLAGICMETASSLVILFLPGLLRGGAGI